jgi:hypothetical protein
VRVRPHIQPLPSAKRSRPHLVEENEGPDHAPLQRRQRSPHCEAIAEIAGRWQDDKIDALGVTRSNGHD